MAGIAIGVIAGLLSGMFGVGGGILIVPGLVLVLGYTQRLASGTSLAAIVPTAVVGVASYALGGYVDWPAALLLAAGAVVGAQLGTWLLPRVPILALTIAFAVLLMIVVVTLFLVVPSRSAMADLDVASGVALVGIGVITGVLSGLFGIGGGLVVVPALLLLLGVGDLVARGTSLLMMIPTAISGSIGNLRRSNVDLLIAGAIGFGACLFAPVGAWVARTIDPLTANIAFAALLTAATIQLVVRAVRRTRS